MTFPGSPWRRLYESRAVPAALLALFVVLIGSRSCASSIWYDESCSLEFVSENSYANILKFTTADVHPPLWYLALKPWVTLFGATTFASRAQSAVFMIVAVALWYHLVRTRMSRPLALLALALMVTTRCCCTTRWRGGCTRAARC